MRRLAAVFFACFLFSSYGSAQSILKVEEGKAQILSLGGTPTVVVVGNPRVADVIVESPNIAFILGVSPGETNLYILDESGNALARRNIVVTPVTSGSIVVNRKAGDTTYSCSPRCAEVVEDN